MLGEVDAATGLAGVVDAVAAVVVQGDVDGVGGQIQPVHDPGASCLEVAVRVGLLVGDLGAVPTHEGRGVDEGLGHLVETRVGWSLARPGLPAGQAGLDGDGLRSEAGHRSVALVDARPPARQGDPQVLRGRDHRGPAAQQCAGVVAVEVHEQLAGEVVDVEEHLADAAHVARGHRALVDVEELLVDGCVRQAQVSSQGRGLP